MNINNQQLISSLSSFSNTKNIDKPTLIRMLDDVLKNLIIQKFGTTENFDIVINPQKGDIQIWRYKEIVADESKEVGDPDKISLSEARKSEESFQVGEQFAEEIGLNTFTRRAIKQALTLLKQKIQNIETTKLYEMYKNLEGELINAEVYYIDKNNIMLYDEQRNECVLPHKEIIPGETYRKGKQVQAVIHKVYIQKDKVAITLSRTSPKLLERLLEVEIPEIADKLVLIKKIVRQPGIRAKVAVMTYDDRIDPVGACIGIKGFRIRRIIHALQGEQIDIINYTENQKNYINRVLGLKPGMVTNILNKDDVIILDFKPGQIPLAIGSKGQNITLASKLIGKEIKINDIYIEEFSNELSESTLETLKSNKLTTAKMILALTKEELLQKTQLDLETLDQLHNLLNNKIQLKNYTS